MARSSVEGHVRLAVLRSHTDDKEGAKKALAEALDLAPDPAVPTPEATALVVSRPARPARRLTPA